MGEMINVQELRLGNWVKSDPYGEFPIVGLIAMPNDPLSKSTAFKNLEYYPQGNNCEDLHPIPITEEWLTKKFIFKQIDKYTFVLNGIFIHKRLSGFIFNIGKRKIKLNSIHQLQNLYFALTQKELILNE